MYRADGAGDCCQVRPVPWPGVTACLRPAPLCRHVLCDCSALLPRLCPEHLNERRHQIVFTVYCVVYRVWAVCASLLGLIAQCSCSAAGHGVVRGRDAFEGGVCRPVGRTV